MRILSLQPEIDPRAYKINTTLAEMYPDVEIVTLFGDECHYLNQRSKAAILGSFVPEKHYFAVNKWSIPKESFIKFYAPATETYARFVAGKIKRFVKAHNVDIIHARPPPDFLGYAAKRYTSYPVVSEIYDMMSLTGHHMNTRAKGVREGLFKFRNNMRADKMEKWESYIAEHSDYFVIPYQGIAHILSR
ncbi:MAG: hypothetical protein QCI38_09040, partial [Candidatus Thermoplasmatota archaeon]|nr:hypothetical protein [Candidatus Thermoplasmatota archaeon]